jgi:hypothetical protein
MTTNRPTTASRRPKAAVLTAAAAAALSLAAIPAFASAAPAAPAFAGPTVHEQQHLNIDILIATGAGFAYRTTVVKSPVLARGSYAVNEVLGIDNVAPGAVVLCGTATTQSGDVTTYNYGQVENVDGQELATCDSTGTITINGRHDHVTGWADIYSGTGGAYVSEFSMNETPVGSVITTH